LYLLLSILLGVLLFLVCFYVLFFRFFLSSSRYFSAFSRLYHIMTSAVSPLVGNSVTIFMFSSILIINIIGNIPLASVPTIYYSFTFSLSLLFWVPIIICVSVSQLKDFMAHMLPYGSPVALMLFLPLVEIFSQIIRPLTLMIRLSTNISAGHIIMYIFSYFTLLSSLLSPFIHIVLILLLVLELCISALQAYIFASLVSLYIRETV
jgi:ATP synthase subunit 6